MSRPQLAVSTVLKWLLPLALLGQVGCLQTDLNMRIFADGSARMRLVFDLNAKALPPFVKDPLAGIDTPENLRAYKFPGIYAWAEPIRTNEGGHQRVELTAYIPDVGRFWFYKIEEGKVVRALSFSYDPENMPGRIGLDSNLSSELQEPLPLEGVPGTGGRLSPEAVATLMPVVRPFLKNMNLRATVVVPGPVQRASGFDDWQENIITLNVDRERFLQAATVRAGVLCDEFSLEGDDPAIIWDATEDSPEELAAFREEMAVAREWWVANRPKN